MRKAKENENENKKPEPENIEELLTCNFGVFHNIRIYSMFTVQ